MGFYFRHHYVGTLGVGPVAVRKLLDEVRSVVDRRSPTAGHGVGLEVVESPQAINATFRVPEEQTPYFSHVTLFLREIFLPPQTQGEWGIVGYQTSELDPSLYLVLYDVFDYILQHSPMWIVLYHEVVDPDTEWVFLARAHGEFNTVRERADMKAFASYRDFLKFKERVNERYRRTV